MSATAPPQSVRHAVDPTAPELVERGFVASVGAELVGLATTARELYSVLVRTLYYCFRGRREKGATVRQMFEIGNRSLPFLTIVMGFLGMIMVYQAAVQAKRVVPNLSLLGATFLQLLVRDLAASIGAMMLATRVGTGIAAELGSMVVTEQVDALRMCAADPIDYLVKPRFIASLVMTTVLVIWSGAVAYASGMVTAYAMFDVLPNVYLSTSMVHAGDLVVGLAKCVVYGTAIPIVSAHAGLTAHGGSEGVGSATTRAVVNSSLAVIFLDLFVSTAGYLVFP